MKLKGMKLLDGVDHAQGSPGCSWIVLVGVCVSVIAVGYRQGYKPAMVLGGVLLIALLRMGYKAFVIRD